MNAKHITGIKIENFRGHRCLELTGFQSVNLIVGPNNAGKTSLLEAITAVAAPGLIKTLPGLFRANSGRVLERYFRWLIADGAECGDILATTPDGKMRCTFSAGDLPAKPDVGYKDVQSFGGYKVGWWAKNKKQFNTRIVSVQHRAPEHLVPNFADAVRSPESERLMEQLLSKVDSRIRTVRLDYADQDPFISVDIGLSERVPLPQAGQGIYRIIAILSELLGMRPQICLIDEIENGIHYTALKQIWRGISEISSTLGIQVFATTHSRECLEAANQVFLEEDESKDKDFSVIQLMRVKDDVLGKVLGETSVGTALENDIELR